MADATLTVPARFADDFRAACAHEFAEEAGYVKKDRREYLQAVDREDTGKKATYDRSSLKTLARDAELFRQVGYDGEGDIEINLEDDMGVVAYVCETVARKVVAPQLVAALNCHPIETEDVARYHDLLDRLRWAIDAAAGVHAGYGFERAPEEVAR